MNEEELNLADYWRIIKKKRKLIALITLCIVLLALVHYSVKPKLYGSEATVQLAVVGSKSLFTHAEAKNIIESSTILGPVLDTLFKEGKKPSVSSFKNYLEVEIIHETIGRNTQVVLPLLKIRVKANNPVLSQKLTLAVTNQWMEYINKEFNIQKDLIISRYNGSRDDLWDDIRLERYYSRVEYLQGRIEQTQENIATYQKEVAELESQIRTISVSGLSEGGIAKTSLLLSILNDYKSRLTEAKDTLFRLEEELKQADIDFEEGTLQTESSREDRERTFTELFLYMKEPAIIDYPEVPNKPITPGIKHDMLIGLGLGLLISISVAFILEWTKKRK